MRRSRRTRFGPAAVVTALLTAGFMLQGCGGGSSGGGGGGPLEVVQVLAMPNGNPLPISPNPAAENQYLRIEFSKGVHQTSIFDPASPNGVSAALQLTNWFYAELDKAPIMPPGPLSKVPLEGFLVWNGFTNFDVKNGVFLATDKIQRVSPEQVGISRANWVARPNVLYFIANTDGDPATAESFVPKALGTRSFQASQIEVEIETSIEDSKRQEKLATRFETNFNVGARDSIYPVIKSVTPSRDAAQVSTNAAVKIRFIEPINLASVQLAPRSGPTASSNLIVESVVGGPGEPHVVQVPGSIFPMSGHTKEIVFTPESGFPADAVARVTIRTGAGNFEDLSENELTTSKETNGCLTFTVGKTSRVPMLANNPIEPEVIHFITAGSAVGAIRVNPLDRAATRQEDVIQAISGTGGVSRFIPGILRDAVVGPMIANLRGVGTNSIRYPPRQCQYWLRNLVHRGNPPTDRVVLPGQYAPAGAADLAACVTTAANPNPPTSPPPPNYCPEERRTGFYNLKPVQPYGSYLFVTNEAENVVHCISGHTYEILKDIPTPDPRGLSISPDLKMLFVTNFADDSLSVLDVTAGKDGLPKGSLIRRVEVGQGPWGVAVAPTGEDAHVCNRVGKTVSVVQVSQLRGPQSPVRVTYACSDPVEAHIGPRVGKLPQHAFLPYYAIVTNPSSGEVSIFEAGPQQINGFGRDRVIDVKTGLPEPFGVTGDQWYNSSPGGNPIPSGTSLTGAFIAMRGDGTVRHLKLTRAKFSTFPNPPPALIEARFEITSSISVGAAPADVCVENNVIYCTTSDGKQWPYAWTNPVVTAVPSRLYVAHGDGTIGVYSIATGGLITKLSTPGATRVWGYYKE